MRTHDDMDHDDAAVTAAAAARPIARLAGRHGELALVERDGDLEIVSNGVFLSDTRDGRSERLLVATALEASRVPVRRLLIGGLGVGFSLAEALDRGVPDILVVECEPAVVAWNGSHTGRRTGGRVTAPGVRCHVGDLVAWLRTTTEVFDAICLDVDNGPDWVVGSSNAWLYGDEGVSALQAALTEVGVLTVWSAARSPGFEARLQQCFPEVAVHEVAVARGDPDVVLVACRTPTRKPPRAEPMVCDRGPTRDH